MGASKFFHERGFIPFFGCSNYHLSRLDKNGYTSIAAFVLDVRRVFANCLRFNTVVGSASLRPIAKNMISTTEDLLRLFLKDVNKKTKQFSQLLYCWKSCLEILDDILKLKNGDDGFPTAHYFLFPASFYYGGQLPEEYSAKVKKPCDFGTITTNLFEGKYQSVNEFVRDCFLVPANCKAYYEGKEDRASASYVAQADRLNQFMKQNLDALLRYDKSQTGHAARKASENPVKVVATKPPKIFFVAMLQELRKTSYTDKFTKVSFIFSTKSFDEDSPPYQFSPCR